MTSADVMWQDGSVECNIRSNDLFPVHHLDNNEFCPGDFVVDKRGSTSPRRARGGQKEWAGALESELGGGCPSKAVCSKLRLLLYRAPSGPTVQSCPDPAVYGVVQSGDHIGRTCMVKWFKLRPSGDDVEVRVGKPHSFFPWAVPVPGGSC